MIRKDIERRFWARVRKTDSCWLWLGASVKSTRYGRAWDGERVDYAHRIAYRLRYGSIPDGMYVCHHCDNPPCVNSDHLFAGTAKQNMQDCKAKGRLVVDALVNRDRFGEANGCAKLTKKDVMWARSNGLTNGETAYRLGVSHTTISKIRSRKIWASF
jgi:hypothetical protein